MSASAQPRHRNRDFLLLQAGQLLSAAGSASIGIASRCSSSLANLSPSIRQAPSLDELGGLP